MVIAMSDKGAIAARIFRRSPPWLALFALLLQFVAAFGHLHPEDYRFLVAGHGLASVHAGSGPAGPALPALPPDSNCPICASAFLLGNAPMPVAAALPAPRDVELAAAEAGQALWLTRPRHLLFISRGPPLV
jgi:hypothetical protein